MQIIVQNYQQQQSRSILIFILLDNTRVTVFLSHALIILHCANYAASEGDTVTISPL